MDRIATRSATCATLKFTGRFTGQGMGEDMTLYQLNITKIDSEPKNVLKLTNANEKQWLKSQNELIKLKIARQYENAHHQKIYVRELLKKCKNHAGPLTSIEELHDCVGQNNETELKRRLEI